MKIAICGDVHLGASYNIGRPHDDMYVNSRLIDYRTTLEKTIDEMAEAGAKQLVFTGDIFEHRIPTLVQQKVFSEALHYATSRGMEQIHIVIGNHDQNRRNNSTTLSYLKELNLPNIHVYDETTAIELVEDDKAVANLVLMPYRDRKWYGVESYNAAIEMVEKELQYQIASIEKPGLPKVLVGHVAIEGTFIGDEEYLDLYGENQLFLPKALFKDLDIVLMGHIHEPMVLQQEGPYIAYVGSMEKRGGFETHDKLFALIDTETCKVEYRKEPCREIFDIKLDYSHLTLGELLKERIQADIDEFARHRQLAESIVKLYVKIGAADDKYVVPRQLYKYFKEKWKVHHCGEIRPEIFSARQARNDQITEQVSDTEAFKIFLMTAIEDPDLRAETLLAGIDIIKQTEAKNAAG